jgi:hypothetical protein
MVGMLGVELSDEGDISAEIHPGFARILLEKITSTYEACSRCGRVCLQRITTGTYFSPFTKWSAAFEISCRPGEAPVDETGNISG